MKINRSNMIQVINTDDLDVYAFKSRHAIVEFLALNNVLDASVENEGDVTIVERLWDYGYGDAFFVVSYGYNNHVEYGVFSADEDFSDSREITFNHGENRWVVETGPAGWGETWEAIVRKAVKSTRSQLQEEATL